jgi:hypothetical protein
MQSKKEFEFIIDLEAYDTENAYPMSFRLYEEYSQRNIAETIRTRRENFEKADLKTQRELVREAESEVESFRVWLKETKGFQPSVARNYSVSLKSLLLGLSVGVRIARLFDIIINAQTKR